MIYLLDTNVISEISVRPRPAPEVVSWAKSLPAGNMYISVITIGEIEAGDGCDPAFRADRPGHCRGCQASARTRHAA